MRSLKLYRPQSLQIHYARGLVRRFASGITNISMSHMHEGRQYIVEAFGGLSDAPELVSQGLGDFLPIFKYDFSWLRSSPPSPIACCNKVAISCSKPRELFPVI